MLRAGDAPAVSPQKKRGQKIVRAELFFLDRGPFIGVRRWPALRWRERLAITATLENRYG